MSTQSSSSNAAAENIPELSEENPSTLHPSWTDLPKTHPLHLFSLALGGPSGILSKTSYNEMYGVTLVAGTEDKSVAAADENDKFLRANMGDLELAKGQLVGALEWRKGFQPLRVREEVFDGDKFAGLGYVMRVKKGGGEKEMMMMLGDGEEEAVVAFNVYGRAARESKEVFGDVEAFVRWRVAQMELTLQELKLNEATKTIPDYGKGPDPYSAINVHDYLSVSFFRQPAEIKASSSKIIDLFQRYYPETVSHKYFVNVPLVMQWMMGAMKALMSKDSIQRMTWLTYGEQLHVYLGSGVPKEYGGKGEALEGNSSAITPRYAAAIPSTGSTATASQGEESVVAPNA